MRSAACVAIGLGAIACGVLVAGCQPESYRAETRLHSDGSVERAVYQPSLPEPALKPGTWEMTTTVPRIEPPAWEGSIKKMAVHHKTELTARDENDTPADANAYKAAWGRFASVDLIPDHFVVESRDPARQSRLKRVYATQDHVFVIEHSWQETLTEIVSLREMRAARLELAELQLSLVEAVLAAGLEPGHDVSKLSQWLRSEGIPWFDECCDAYVESRASRTRRGVEWDTEFVERLIEICEKRGLRLSDADGRRLENPELEERLLAFAAQKLRDLVRGPNDAPPDDKTMETILVWLRIKRVKDEEGNDIPSPLDATQQSVIETKYGGAEAFQTRVETLLSRFFGLYGSPLKRAQLFHYTLQIPGLVVGTSGELLSDDEVRWAFDSAEAYPFGYTMTCRSLEPQVERQRRLLGECRVCSRQDMQQFVEVVSADGEILAVLRQSVAEQNLEPLQRFRESREQAEPRTRKLLQRLLTLLDLGD